MEKNNLVFRGVVGYVSPQVFGTDKNGKQTKKGYFIVGEPYGTHPNEIKIDWFNRKTSVDNLQVGDEVEVSFNLSCNEWNGKHIFTANLWKMNNLSNPVSNEEIASAATSENKYASLKQPVSVPMPQPEDFATKTPTQEDSGLPF